MAIIYDWDIESLEVAPNENGMDNVVKGVNWTCAATEGTASANMAGYVPLLEPDVEAFLPFDELEKDQVVAWVQEVLAGQEIELALANAIKAQQNPPTRAVPPPWI